MLDSKQSYRGGGSTRARGTLFVLLILVALGFGILIFSLNFIFKSFEEKDSSVQLIDIAQNQKPEFIIPEPLKRVENTTKSSDSFTPNLLPDLLWKTGRVAGYVDIPAQTLLIWKNNMHDFRAATSKEIRGDYYYAVREFTMPRSLEDAKDGAKEDLRFFAHEFETLGFVRRGPTQTLGSFDDDYIKVSGLTARAASVHMGFGFNTNCPERERTELGEFCSPLSVVNIVYSVFVSEPFPVTWNQ